MTKQTQPTNEWTFETMKKTMDEMVRANFVNFAKAFISVELDVRSKAIVNQLYVDFTNAEGMPLINDELSSKADNYKDVVAADITNILEKLHQTGEPSACIQDLLETEDPGALYYTLEEIKGVDVEDYHDLSFDVLHEFLEDFSTSSLGNNPFDEFVHEVSKAGYLQPESNLLELVEE